MWYNKSFNKPVSTARKVIEKVLDKRVEIGYNELIKNGMSS